MKNKITDKRLFSRSIDLFELMAVADFIYDLRKFMSEMEDKKNAYHKLFIKLGKVEMEYRKLIIKEGDKMEKYYNQNNKIK